MPDPGTGEQLLRTAHQLIVENDDVANTLELPRLASRLDVIREICRHLAPYQAR